MKGLKMPTFWVSYRFSKTKPINQTTLLRRKSFPHSRTLNPNGNVKSCYTITHILKKIYDNTWRYLYYLVIRRLYIRNKRDLTCKAHSWQIFSYNLYSRKNGTFYSFIYIFTSTMGLKDGTKSIRSISQYVNQVNLSNKFCHSAVQAQNPNAPQL